MMNEAAQTAHPHAALIEALGGVTALATAIGAKQRSLVSNWLLRGISFQYRPLVADIAKRKRVKLPKDFLKPGA